MSLSEKQSEELSKYKSASWALWKDGSTEESYYDFFIRNKHLLKNNIVFLGLNRSGTLSNVGKDERFANFHKEGHRGDNTLRKYIQENNLKNLIGGYMTDIEGDKVDLDSKKVKVGKKAFEEFKRQLNELNCK